MRDRRCRDRPAPLKLSPLLDRRPTSGPRTRVPRLGLLRLRPDPVHGSPSRGPLLSRRVRGTSVVRLRLARVKGRPSSAAQCPVSSGSQIARPLLLERMARAETKNKHHPDDTLPVVRVVERSWSCLPARVGAQTRQALPLNGPRGAGWNGREQPAPVLPLWSSRKQTLRRPARCPWQAS